LEDEEEMSDLKNKLTPVMALLTTSQKPTPVMALLTTSQKPTFYEVIQGQTSDGNWDVISREILARCIKGP